MTTETEIPTGPELDRAVAEQVMGWTIEDRGPLLAIYRTGLPAPFASKRNGTCSSYRYSTDISIAWEVIEVMQARGQYIGLYFDGENWVCESRSALPRPNSSWVEYRGVGESAPEAICRAALLAASDKTEVRESDEDD